jgi:saccharopine dehydrogenase-like NADP-dependent oxidoreductase
MEKILVVGLGSIGRKHLKNLLTKDELEGALIYLASNANSSVIVQNIIVDVGWTTWSAAMFLNFNQ